MRAAALLALLATSLQAAPAGEFVHAVEFPYRHFPRQFWERELVWLKNIGVNTVLLRVDAPSELLPLLRTFRKLELRAWLKCLAPLEGALETQVAAHGGPIAFGEGCGLGVIAPPVPLTVLSANDPAALLKSRTAMAASHGTLLWQDVEDAPLAPVFRHGAVSLNGEEKPAVAALRRSAGLLRQWSALLPGMKPVRHRIPGPLTVIRMEPLKPGGPGAASVVNNSRQPYAGPLPILKIPRLELAAGQALWLPVEFPLAGPLCHERTAFAKGERIVYATAELQTVEYENGILAMEFSAPAAGEVVLQLTRQPTGPYLAAGKPTKFDYDEKTLRARLPIPAGKGPSDRVRIGLAIEPPEHSAFFVDSTRLVIGRANRIETSYSSEKLAARSRLRLPEGYTAKAERKSDLEISYDVAVPPDALHGSWANFAIEADGVPLGRARLQLFRPASVRLSDAITRHFGDAEMAVEPYLIAFDPKAGRNVDVVIRNNSPRIQTYTVEASGEDLEFLPARQEVSIGAVLERTISVRAFAPGAKAALLPWTLRISGGATQELNLRMVAVPRGRAITYEADLEGNGVLETVVENARVRAVFSKSDGGRWLEFVWKDSGVNVLPENGVPMGTGKISLDGSALTFEGAPADGLKPLEKNAVRLTIRRDPNRAVYSLER